MRQLCLLQSATGGCYKVRQLFYYKVWLRLLQSATGITKCDWGYYKVRQVLQSVIEVLQSATGITKCDWGYYKVRLVLQSVIEVITKCDSTNRAIFTDQNASHFIHTVKANSPANKKVQTGNRMDFLVGFELSWSYPCYMGPFCDLRNQMIKETIKCTYCTSLETIQFQGRTDPGIPPV